MRDFCGVCIDKNWIADGIIHCITFDAALEGNHDLAKRLDSNELIKDCVSHLPYIVNCLDVCRLGMGYRNPINELR